MSQTLEELQADRAVIAAARLKYLSGEAVKEVTRAGRKLVFNTCSLNDFNMAISLIDSQIAALGGSRRRRALTFSYR